MNKMAAESWLGDAIPPLFLFGWIKRCAVGGDQNLPFNTIIWLYSYRFRIECTFRELKQQVGAFCYHFWPKHMPKLNYYQKKSEPVPLERVEGEKSRRKVLEAIRATEMHMALSCIAMGLLQSLSIYYIGKISPGQIRY